MNRLRGEGKRDSQDVMVISSVPFPEGVLESDRSPIRLPIFTLVFALVGIGLGILLALGSQELYVIRTGGKPIASGPPTAIIAYEVMMLIALVGAFITALFEMRLPSWRAKVYDPRISEGLIGIATYCGSEDEVREAETISARPARRTCGAMRGVSYEQSGLGELACLAALGFVLCSRPAAETRCCGSPFSPLDTPRAAPPRGMRCRSTSRGRPATDAQWRRPPTARR